jgi:hypothetical protein
VSKSREPMDQKLGRLLRSPKSVLQSSGISTGQRSGSRHRASPILLCKGVVKLVGVGIPGGINAPAKC